MYLLHHSYIFLLFLKDFDGTMKVQILEQPRAFSKDSGGMRSGNVLSARCGNLKKSIPVLSNTVHAWPAQFHVASYV